MAGVGLVIVGSLGFFYGAGFVTGSPGIQFLELGGVLVVNGWLNLLHIVVGLLGLAAAPSALASRTYCFCVGALFIVFAVAGVLESGDRYGILVELFPVDPEGDLFHLLVGVLGIAAGITTTPEGWPSRPGLKT